MKRNLCIFLPFCILLLSSQVARAQWVQTNGPEGGQIDCFVSSGASMFAGTCGGGIYISSDSGIGWISRNSGLADWYVRAIVSNGTTVIAGTSTGIYRSTNAGKNWALENLGLTYHSVNCLLTKGTKLFAGTQGGVYVSIDDGISWSVVDSGLLSSELPMDRNVSAFAFSGSDLYAATISGLYLSSNDGVTWSRIDSGLRAPQLSAVVLTGGRIIVGTRDDGAYRSYDKGKHWEALPLPEVVTQLSTVHSTLYAGGGTLFSNVGASFRSTDGGTTWNTLATHTQTTGTAFGSLGSITFAAADGGIVRSLDDGVTWNLSQQGLRNSGTTAFAVDTTNLSSPVIYAAFSQGLFKTSDRGEHWRGVSYDSAITLIRGMIVSDSALIVVGDLRLGDVRYGAAARSTDRGQTWKPISASIRNSFDPPIAKIGKNLLICGEAILRSTDDGFTWAVIDSAGIGSSATSVLVIDSVVFVGSAKGIFRSNDSGRSWSAVNSGLSSKSISALTIARPSGLPPLLFAAVGDFYNGQQSRVFVSADLGDTWTQADSGIVDHNVVALAATSSKIFAGTLGNGVFLSTDFGVSWKSASTDELPPSIPQLLISGSDLYAGSTGGGVWRRPIAEMNAVATLCQSPNAIVLSNFPNPFTTSSQITFTLPEREMVTLEVFDQLGRRVSTVLKDFRSAGIHSETFESSNLPSGVYEAVLSAGSTLAESRLVLSR